MICPECGNDVEIEHLGQAVLGLAEFHLYRCPECGVEIERSYWTPEAVIY